jgi:hypothetical protein
VETYKAQSAEVVIDGDVLTLTRKKIGKDDARRIPLGAITGVRLRPSGKLSAALLQLVLNGEPPADMTNIEQNTLVFPPTPKHKETLAALQARLEAVAEQNRAAGGGPVAYDAPRKGVLDRAIDKMGEVSDRLEESRTHVEVGGERVNKIDAELAEKGITRPDLVAAAHATANFIGISVEIPRLAQVLRPDEPLLRVARATVGERVGLAAVTATRLIFLDEGLWDRAYDEYPLAGIVGTSTESEFMSNALTLRMQSGHRLVLERVEDINGFAAALREAIHQATTPAPVPALPPPTSAPVPLPPPAAQPDVLAQITKLGELHAAGILTDEEFQAKKTELLNRL